MRKELTLLRSKVKSLSDQLRFIKQLEMFEALMPHFNWSQFAIAGSRRLTSIWIR